MLEIDASKPRESRWPNIALHVLRVIGDEPERSRVQVRIIGWESDRRLSFPLRDLPRDLQTQIVPDSSLLAEVNLAAEKASELKPTNFSFPDEPKDPPEDIEPGMKWIYEDPDESLKEGWWEIKYFRDSQAGMSEPYQVRKFPDRRQRGVVREVIFGLV